MLYCKHIFSKLNAENAGTSSGKNPIDVDCIDQDLNENLTQDNEKSLISKITFFNQSPLSIDIYAANYFPDFSIEEKNFFIKLYTENDTTKQEVRFLFFLKSKT